MRRSERQQTSAPMDPLVCGNIVFWKALVNTYKKSAVKNYDTQKVFQIQVRYYDRAIIKLPEVLNIPPKNDPVTKAINRKYFCTHTYRHPCCTRLVTCGVDLRTVQEWMGHGEIKTTQRYSHFIPDRMAEAAHKLYQYNTNEGQPRLTVVPDMTLLSKLGRGDKRR